MEELATKLFLFLSDYNLPEPMDSRITVETCERAIKKIPTDVINFLLDVCNEYMKGEN